MSLVKEGISKASALVCVSFPTCQPVSSSFPWYATLIVALGGTSLLLIIAAFFVFSRLAPAIEKLRFHMDKKKPPGVQIHIQIYGL